MSDRLDQIAEQLERALGFAYSGSAEHGSFRKYGGGEYVPNVFLVLEQLKAATQALREQLEQAQDTVGQLRDVLFQDYEGDDTSDGAMVRAAKNWCANEIHYRERSEALEQRLTTAEQERDALKAAVAWALGEEGAFTERPDGAGLYWWRTELRVRCTPTKAAPEACPSQ